MFGPRFICQSTKDLQLWRMIYIVFSVSAYARVHICMCVHVYIYIYIYICACVHVFMHLDFLFERLLIRNRCFICMAEASDPSRNSFTPNLSSKIGII